MCIYIYKQILASHFFSFPHDKKYCRGREYIDPKSYTEPVDKFGKHLGVRVFKAYSCEFGWNRATPDPNEPLQLCLTVCIQYLDIYVATSQEYAHMTYLYHHAYFFVQ